MSSAASWKIIDGAPCLASDESSFVNATTFVVDRGISAARTTPLCLGRRT